MNFSPDFGFYGILTDPLVGYERLAAVMVANGLQFIQLRMKDAPRQEVLQTAKNLRKIIPPGCLFIINDDPLLTKEVGADGVHLGQEDISFDQAREILGPQAIIGLSTHNIDQTRNACELGPDYIGVGPVFPTVVKKKPDPVIGLDTMSQMIQAASVPAVAIGGIDHSNVKQVLAAGARNICAVRCVNQSADPDRDLKLLLQAIDNHEP